MIGRHRPVEQDAVRVLTVVYQLGEEPDGHLADGRTAERFVDTESQLQHLDHLVNHPIDLAYVLMDQARSGFPPSDASEAEVDARFGKLARRIRRLLDTTSSRKRSRGKARQRYRPSLLRPFEIGSWQRWDDVLAVLSCRGLLRVEPVPGEHDGALRYRLTFEGARWLKESVYGPLSFGEAASANWQERCELLREVLPDRLLSPHTGFVLGHYLEELAARLDAYRDDEQVRPEDDLLGSLFQSTFAEPL